MRTPRALPNCIALSTLLSFGYPTIAQAALPQTPPELREFRLDPKPPTPQPEPVAQPVVVTPPPVVTTAPKRQTAQPRPQSQPQVTDPQAESPPTQTSVPVPPTGVTESVIATDAPDVVAVERPAEDEPQASPVAYWQIAAGLTLATLLLLGGFWLRRRRSVSDIRNRPEDESVVKPAPAQKQVPPKPTLAAPVTAAAKVSKKPALTLDFVPEKATLSFTTLTIKGQLRLTNAGDLPAKDMELRAGLISASKQQDQAIHAFHAASSAIMPKALGDAKPGETTAMAMELSVPLTEMQSFTLGTQQMMVPIMIANLAYRGSDTGAADIATIACMIGREANPPVTKMGPLRLDLGPRSFVALGKRALYA